MLPFTPNGCSDHGTSRIQIDDRARVDTTLPQRSADTITVLPPPRSTSGSNRVAIVASIIGLLFIGGAAAIGMSMGGSTHEVEESGAAVQVDESTYTSKPDVETPRALSPAMIDDAGTTSSDAPQKTPDGAVDGPPKLPSSMVFIPAGTYKIGCRGDGCDRDYQRSFEEKRIYRGVGSMRDEVTTAEYFAVGTWCVFTPPQQGERLSQRRRFGGATADELCLFKDAAFCGGARLETAYRRRMGDCGAGENQQTYPWGKALPTCDLTSMKSAEGKGCGTRVLNVGSKPKDTSWCGARTAGTF